MKNLLKHKKGGAIPQSFKRKGEKKMMKNKLFTETKELIESYTASVQCGVSEQKIVHLESRVKKNLKEIKALGFEEEFDEFAMKEC